MSHWLSILSFSFSCYVNLTIGIILETDDALGIFHYEKVSAQENYVVVWCSCALNARSADYVVTNYRTTLTIYKIANC